MSDHRGYDPVAGVFTKTTPMKQRRGIIFNPCRMGLSLLKYKRSNHNSLKNTRRFRKMTVSCGRVCLPYGYVWVSLTCV